MPGQLLISLNDQVVQNKVRKAPVMKNERKPRKKSYSPPTVSKLTKDQAKQFVTDRTNCSQQEADEVLESLEGERQDWTKQDRTKQDRKAS